MANPVAKRWGTALALVVHGDEKDNQTSTHELGPIWRTERGNLQFRLETIPLSWLHGHGTKRIIVLQPTPPSRK